MTMSKVYAILLYAYPREFRERFGGEMRQVLRDRWRAIFANPQRAPHLRILLVTGFLLATLKDWLLSSIKERIANMARMVLNNWQRRTAKGLGVAVLAVVAYLLITANVMQAYVIAAPSMEGSLFVGDHILVNKLAHGGEIDRDGLIVFKYPEDGRQTFVKRVIGLPGDHIHFVDKQVIRNGRRLVEPYVQHSLGADSYRDNFPSQPPPLVMTGRGMDMLAHNVAAGEITVPERSYFVLGDNRDNSLDSRYFGFVPAGNVVGRPVLVYWTKRSLHMLGPTPPEEVAP